MKKGRVLKLIVTITQEGDKCVAHCPQLDLGSFGDSEQEAREMFREALDACVESMEKSGQLDDLVEELEGTRFVRTLEMEYEFG